MSTTNTMRMSEKTDAAELGDLLDAARRGSNLAYRTAWVKVIRAKQAYPAVKGVMTQTERDAFWDLVRKTQLELNRIKKYVVLT